MAGLGFSFDANSVEPNVPFEVLPPGDYVVQAIASSMEVTKAGTGRFLKVEFEVQGGESAGRKVFDRFNLENPNATAVEIAQRQLSSLCRAIGVVSLSDSEQLHFKKVRVRIATVQRKDAPGEFSNEIKAYLPADGGPGAAEGGAAKGGFTPGAAAAGGTTTAPWKRQG
jgi:hypothetical protein